MSTEERQLADAILKDLQEAFGDDEKLNDFLDELRRGSASMDTAREYARELGGAASEVFQEYAQAFVDAEDGYDAAMEALRATYAPVADYAAQAQSLDNQKAGIGIKGQRADFDKAKASGIAHNVSNALDVGGAIKAVKGPVQTFTEGTITDTIEKNAEFNSDAGFKEYVERRDDGKCCEWCARLSGRYEYGKQPKDFFRQHENCTCTFRHFSEKGTIKSWSGGKGRKQIVLEQKEEKRNIGESKEKQITEREIFEASKKIKEHIPNYGEDAIIADKIYLDSQEYRNKFSGITSSAEIDDIVCKYARQLVNSRSGTEKESIIVLDASKGNIIAAVRTSKNNNQITYDETSNEKIKNAIKEGKKIIAVHNHPEGYPPTPDDCVSALIRGYSKGIAAGHNGEVYEYYPAEQEINEYKCNDIHNSIVRQLNYAYDGESMFSIWQEIMSLNGMTIKRRQ